MRMMKTLLSSLFVLLLALAAPACSGFGSNATDNTGSGTADTGDTGNTGYTFDEFFDLLIDAGIVLSWDAAYIDSLDGTVDPTLESDDTL